MTIPKWKRFSTPLGTKHNGHNCFRDGLTSVDSEANSVRSSVSRGMEICKRLYCYKYGKLLPSNANLMVGKRVLQGKYGVSGSSQAWTPDFADDLGDKFGEEILDLKGAGIFSLSQLGEEITLNALDDSM
ncbi:hypothetical protein AVEN_155271-1 [Araneus ventricosus]|uniref:Uncharacterized protein n=1 Tax=Araneus ventricosus TaxID=182803 RepID=A0A4Y2D826_ARAVE|nr:hypothetical protein AVEN_155271-1 [Araneus ventricosus]